MECKNCNGSCIKKGFYKNGTQKFLCRKCLKWQQNEYRYQAYNVFIDKKIVVLLKEGCGTRSISRILGISTTTVTKHILSIAASIIKPPIPFGKSYEMDEMMTFIGNKERKICIAYTLEQQTKRVVSYSVGRRNKTTLRLVVNSLLLSDSIEIKTDKFSIYQGLIPAEIHCTKLRGTNHIERNNLTIRTHLKRLNRRTIAYSKSLLVLMAVLKIYFWY